MTHPLFQWEALEQHPMRESERYFFSTKRFSRFNRPTAAQGSGMKPAGLWYSCGSAWLQRIQHDPDWLSEYKYLYHLTLRLGVLSLKSRSDVLSFRKHYRAGINIDWNVVAVAHTGINIDWNVVAVAHTGIEICPYYSDLRGRLGPWYDAFDVSSGCIWDSRGLGGVKLITSAEAGWRI